MRKDQEVILRRTWSMRVEFDVTADAEHAILFMFQDRDCRIEVAFDPATAVVLIQHLKTAITASEAWPRSH